MSLIDKLINKLIKQWKASRDELVSNSNHVSWFYILHSAAIADLETIKQTLKQSEKVVEIKRKWLWYQCPNCKEVWNARPNYCYWCWAKIKWID